jgi:hypothetical protein
MRMQCECNVNGMPAMPEMSEMFDMPEAQVVEECRSSKDRRLESRQEQCAQCATYQDVPRRTTTYHDVPRRIRRIRRMQPRLTVCFNLFFFSLQYGPWHDRVRASLLVSLMMTAFVPRLKFFNCVVASLKYTDGQILTSTTGSFHAL